MKQVWLDRRADFNRAGIAQALGWNSVDDLVVAQAADTAQRHHIAHAANLDVVRVCSLHNVAKAKDPVLKYDGYFGLPRLHPHLVGVWLGQTRQTHSVLCVVLVAVHANQHCAATCNITQPKLALTRCST